MMNKLATVGLCLMLLVAANGCTQNPFGNQAAAPWGIPQTSGLAQNNAARVGAGANNLADRFSQNQTAANQTALDQIAELNRRVQLLDADNRQLQIQVAQSEQQSQVHRDYSELLRKQLAEMSQQVQATALAARQAESRVRGIQASTQVGGGTSISPNTNLSQLAGRLNLGGLPVQQDGQVVRITLPSDQLFQQGTGNLLPQAANLIDPVATQLRSLFPRNRIGIEGYADNGPLYGGNVASTHHLTALQTASILDLMTTRFGFPANQLFTVAQGSNNPRGNNQTPAGRATNRRIELVIYPQNY